MKRPAGVAFLGILNFIGVAWTAFFAVFMLIAPQKFAGLVDAIDHWTAPFGDFQFTPGIRLALSALAIAFGLIGYLVSRAFWRLKNWARILMIVACFLTILDGGVFPFGDPFWKILPANPWTDLAARLLSIVVIFYLQTAQVRSAFGKPPLSWGWRFAWAAATVLALTYPRAKSGPELRAIKWHAKYGNTYAVNGVRFPVYYWNAP